MPKAVVGLSGGVDSAVCAAILRDEGYKVTGVYLDAGFSSADDARRVADTFGIELIIVDTARIMREEVIKPFYAAYAAGRTPNPCVDCNPNVKFKLLFNEADRLGADIVATGHYARVDGGALWQGPPGRDQSYMLYRLRHEWLHRLRFPLYNFDKAAVRAKAEALGLPVAGKKDSMDLCFPVEFPEKLWTLCDAEGNILGEQKGFFTVGQRRGLGKASDGRLYVCAIDPAAGIVTLGPREAVTRSELPLRHLHWLIGEPYGPLRCAARIRHGGKDVPAMIYADSNPRVVFDEPVFGGAPGQSAVFYEGGKVLGGGEIDG